MLNWLSFPNTLLTPAIYGIRFTVEPPNNGHGGDEHFVHCSEVVPSSEVLPVSTIISLVYESQCIYIINPRRVTVLVSVCLSVCYHLIVDIVRFYGITKVCTVLF